MTQPSVMELSSTHGNAFDQRALQATGENLTGLSIETIQVNIGLKCDLACCHCHVESSPLRTEQMDWPTMELILVAAEKARARTIDITGGAPEMNPHFQRFVIAARKVGIQVTVRTNLTILLKEGYTELPGFYRANQVRLIASLPCYLEENVDRQRGRHVYEKSIEVIRRLNRLGYGIFPELQLSLVFNPLGTSLPPEQSGLERAYRLELSRRFGIRFTRLITIANMPIGRFLHDLRREGKEEAYRRLLKERFNPETLPNLMCRRQLHVSWDGTLHDCDFNYALRLGTSKGAPAHIRDFDPAMFLRRRILTGEHCFGCAAGRGSSCGGALV